MDYIMIERHLFDALVRGVRECRSALDTALSPVGCHRNGWVDNNSAQAILQRSTRTMQSLRSSGRIGYSIIDGKVFYPEKEIARVLNQHYLLIPYLSIHTSFEGRFKETAIDSDAHIHRRVTVFQQLLPLYIKEDAESRFSLLHVK